FSAWSSVISGPLARRCASESPDCFQLRMDRAGAPYRPVETAPSLIIPRRLPPSSNFPAPSSPRGGRGGSGPTLHLAPWPTDSGTPSLSLNTPVLGTELLFW